LNPCDLSARPTSPRAVDCSPRSSTSACH
jgi:hypothetical protein